MAASLSFSPFPLDRTGSTRMLKDFLQESNANGIATSKPKTASFKALAIHAVRAAVKRISFPSVKSPRIFPRSLSRRLLRKTERDDEREIGGDFVVKVKDVIRWKSFRDLIDETAAVDLPDWPDRYTAAATSTTTTTATSSCSSSWCESDFTVEDFPSPSWRGCSDDGRDGEIGKIYFPCVGEDSTETTAAHAENDKKDALSRRLDKEEEENVMEERARRLLEHVKEAMSLSENCRVVEHCRLDRLFLELFRQEQESEDDDKRVRTNEKISTMKAKEDESNDYEWFLSQKGKETCVKEMEREGKWEMFGVEEKVELGIEMEEEILGCLVDEILLDTFQ